MATLVQAIERAQAMSREDGCTRYVSARIVVRPDDGGFAIDPTGYRVTDWSDDACVVQINHRGEATTVV